MKNWLYNNKEIKEIDDFGKNVFGFIYKITNKETGKFYIGKKTLSFVRNKKLGKKETAALKEERKNQSMRGAVPKKKKVITESDWKDYFGSSKELTDEINKIGKDKYSREILQLSYNSKQNTYFEVLYQMKYDVLRRDDCFNNSILGKFSNRDFL